MAESQILIVGAGPTGLMLALRLARHGTHFRIIDKNLGPGLASRAMVVHARTLEFYDQLGLADQMIAEGLKLKAIHIREHGREIAVLDLINMGDGLSPFPFALSYPQDDHEKFLIKRLKAIGIEVEWNTALQSMTQDSNGVEAQLQKAGKNETARFAYLCGCDGARSKTRDLLNLDFAGGTYQHVFYVADVKLEKETGQDGQMSFGEYGFVLQFPIRFSGMTRLIGIVPQEVENQEHLSFEDMRHMPEDLLGVQVQQVNWFSTYHVHHRVAAKFKSGRCFLLGDAAHIHSPAGGQGLNTGLGDAVNLSWKLAHVLKNCASVELLNSFEPERMRFAKKLVATTDTAFSLMVSGGLQAKLVRGFILPYVMPLLLRLQSVRRLAFKTVSQTEISYRQSPISLGRVGKLQAGDRLPWVNEGGVDNFATLRNLDWQIHVIGTPQSSLQDYCHGVGLALYHFPWSNGFGSAGFNQKAIYLIRPDGHIALVTATQDVAKLQTYIAQLKLVFLSRKLN